MLLAIASTPFVCYPNGQFRLTRLKVSPLLFSPILKSKIHTIAMRSSLTTSSDNVDVLQAAAKLTVDTYIKNGMVIGLGSGHASLLAIQYLGQRLRSGAIKDIVGIPTRNKNDIVDPNYIKEGDMETVQLQANHKWKGRITLVIRESMWKEEDRFLIFDSSYGLLEWLTTRGDSGAELSSISISSASEAAKAGIPLDRYEDTSLIDFAFNDADIIEEKTLIAVIGHRKLQGEESLIQEKNIVNAAKKLAFIVTEKQYKDGLEGSVPVLVPSFNWMEPAEEIDDLFLGDAEVWRRPSIGLAGPTGGDFPLMTKEGHNILDVIFTSPILSLAEIARSLDSIGGVIDHGIICKIPCTAVIASKDGVSFVENSLNTGK